MIKDIKTKHLDSGFQQRLEGFSKLSDESAHKIKALRKQCEALSELCEEFLGFHSDEEEEELVNHLHTSVLHEMIAGLKLLSESNDSL